MAKSLLKTRAERLALAVENYRLVQRYPDRLVRIKDKVVDVKADFHAAGRSFLRDVLKRLGVPGKIRVNKAGDAVSGEVSLRTDRAYICFEVGYVPESFVYRTCKNGKDGSNQWLTYEALVADPEGFAGMIALMHQTVRLI